MPLQASEDVIRITVKGNPMAIERTFVMLKPDALERKLVGELIGRIEQKGLQIIALRLMRIDKALAEKLYAPHREKPFFKELVEFVTSASVVAMIVEGPEAIKVIRKLMGATNPVEAEAGTIRGDFGLDLTRNLIHGSDSKESTEREIPLFFG